MLFRTIILHKFRLNSYRDQLSLSSVYSSEIQIANSHRWTNYEKTIRDIAFLPVNAGSTVFKPSSNSQGRSVESRSIRELQQQIVNLSIQQVVSSQLQVWVTFIRFQGKWCYGACNNPKCKRSADSGSKCVHCGTFNQQVHHKFMLPVELTDFTGSLWTTAFDDFALDIFKGHSLQHMQQLNEQQLKEMAEQQLYQQFKVKINTKKDNQSGNIRHAVVGRVTPINVEKALNNNLAKIKKAIDCE